MYECVHVCVSLYMRVRAGGQGWNVGTQHVTESWCLCGLSSHGLKA